MLVLLKGFLTHLLTGDRIDCGQPPQIPGADYGDFIDTRYQANFFFGCKDEAFRLVGKSSKNTNIVTCQENGVWDFGNLRFVFVLPYKYLHINHVFDLFHK